MKHLKTSVLPALKIFLIFTVVCGVIYTAAITGFAQIVFPDKANGSIIEVDGKKYGSELLGQQFIDDTHMWGRIMIIDGDRKSTRLNSSHSGESRMPSSA